MQNAGVQEDSAARPIDWIAWLILAAVMLGFSSNIVVGRLVAANISPNSMSFWRMAIASAALFLIARRHILRDRALLVAHWKILLLLSLFGFFTTNLTSYWGLRYTTALNALLLNSITPVAVMAMSQLFFRDRATLMQIVGMLVSLCGVVTIIVRGDLAVLLHLHVNIGDLLILCGVFGYSAYTATLRNRPPVHPLALLFCCYFPAMLMFAPFYILDIANGQPAILDGRAYALLAYLALIPGVLCYFGVNIGVQRIGPNRAGMATHMMPVFGAVLSILLLGEYLHWFHLGGAALIFAGLAMAQMRRDTRHRAEKPTAV